MCFLNIFINILMNLEEQNSKSTDAFDECLKSFKKVKKEVYPLKDTQKTVSFINVHKQTKFSLQNNKSVINFSRSFTLSFCLFFPISFPPQHRGSESES